MQVRTTFETINQFAARKIIPRNAIDNMVKEGIVPGFRSGNRYYINTPVFIEQLNKMNVVDTEKLTAYIKNIPGNNQ